MRYDEYINSKAWKKRRNRKLRTAIWHGRFVFCRGCQCFVWFSFGNVQVHHLTYARLGRERDEDLVVLCRGCHAYLHCKPTPGWWNEARRKGLFGCAGRASVRAEMLALIEAGEREPSHIYRAALFKLAPKITPVRKLVTIGDCLAAAFEVIEKRLEGDSDATIHGRKVRRDQPALRGGGTMVSSSKRSS